MIIRALASAEDHAQAWRLAMLAFGGDLSAPVPDTWLDRTGRSVGAFDDAGRLVGRAEVKAYEQWWGGRPVTMAGIAGVVVHPAARGQGLVGRLLDAGLEDEPVSVLFPTAPGIYRPLGWEVVGHLDWTPVPLGSLPRPTGTVRSADASDLSAISGLYEARGRSGSGLLTRTGESFANGVAALLDHDVVTVAEQDGVVAGVVAYSRGKGYDGTGELSVWDCLSSTPTALRALLGSLRSWSAVVGTALWRGSTTELGLALGVRLPPPRSTQPWMLRVLDPVAAVAARGFAPGTHGGRFSMDRRAFELRVEHGRGELHPVQESGLPELSAQGMALLYAGVGRSLHRTGHASAPVPELEAAFAGPAPEILDYF